MPTVSGYEIRPFVSFWLSWFIKCWYFKLILHIISDVFIIILSTLQIALCIYIIQFDLSKLHFYNFTLYYFNLCYPMSKITFWAKLLRRSVLTLFKAKNPNTENCVIKTGLQSRQFSPMHTILCKKCVNQINITRYFHTYFQTQMS